VTCDDLALLDEALPEGADLGTVRLLPRAERAVLPAPISPLLLPLADGGERDLFARYLPAERAARGFVVCAVDRQSGVFAPLCSSLKGFAAYLLLLRRAQASLPAHAGFAVAELLEETDGAARRLAAIFGLEDLLALRIDPRPEQLAQRLLAIEPASPWACSVLAHQEDEPERALKILAPALAAAPFAAGLLEQAAELLLAAGKTRRGALSLFAALGRLEPSLQAAPYRLDDPDEESGALFEPFRPAQAFHFLQESAGEIDREMRAQAPWSYLSRKPSLEPVEVVEASRRRGLAGDLPGARWILHFALGEQPADQKVRWLLCQELARTLELAGLDAIAERFESAAGQARTTMEAGGALM
jgi:hypothetical protein